jgi:hypothetical protein
MKGVAVVQAGTALAIQKTGILGVPFANLGVCTARYQSGELHAPTGICPTMAKRSRATSRSASRFIR